MQQKVLHSRGDMDCGGSGGSSKACQLSDFTGAARSSRDCGILAEAHSGGGFTAMGWKWERPKKSVLLSVIGLGDSQYQLKINGIVTLF